MLQLRPDGSVEGLASRGDTVFSLGKAGVPAGASAAAAAAAAAAPLASARATPEQLAALKPLGCGFSNPAFKAQLLAQGAPPAGVPLGRPGGGRRLGALPEQARRADGAGRGQVGVRQGAWGRRLEAGSQLSLRGHGACERQARLYRRDLPVLPAGALSGALPLPGRLRAEPRLPQQVPGPGRRGDRRRVS